MMMLIAEFIISFYILSWQWRWRRWWRWFWRRNINGEIGWFIWDVSTRIDHWNFQPIQRKCQRRQMDIFQITNSNLVALQLCSTIISTGNHDFFVNFLIWYDVLSTICFLLPILYFMFKGNVGIREVCYWRTRQNAKTTNVTWSFLSPGVVSKCSSSTKSSLNDNVQNDIIFKNLIKSEKRLKVFL